MVYQAQNQLLYLVQDPWHLLNQSHPLVRSHRLVPLVRVSPVDLLHPLDLRFPADQLPQRDLQSLVVPLHLLHPSLRQPQQPPVFLVHLADQLPLLLLYFL